MKSSNATPPNTGDIGGAGPVSAAKAYRLLKAIMNTAVEDKMIKSNPCQIKSGGKEESLERPTLTVRQIFALTDVIEPRSRALVLLATSGSLRWGELAAMTGASLTGLTARMGHSTTKAVLVYLHAAKDRDRAIADALGEIVKEGLKPEEDEPPAKSKIN